MFLRVIFEGLWIGRVGFGFLKFEDCGDVFLVTGCGRVYVGFGECSRLFFVFFRWSGFGVVLVWIGRGFVRFVRRVAYMCAEFVLSFGSFWVIACVRL